MATPGKTTYAIKVVTGKLPGSGTDANVYCIVTGANKATTGKLKMEYSDHLNKFEAGNADTFAVEGNDVGKIETLTLGHDGGGGLLSSSAWYCEKAKLTNLSTGECQHFMINKWFDSKKDDKKNRKNIQTISSC